MRVLINDKLVDALTPRVASSLLLGRELAEVKGRALAPAEATEAYIGQTRRWFTILSVVAIVLMLAVVVAGLASDPNDAAFLIVGTVVIVAALLLFMVLLLRHRVHKWNARLQHRVEGLAPAGTAVFLDAQGLAVGAEIFAWPALTLAQIELTGGGMPSGETSSLVHVIERLVLSAGSRSVVLDRTMMENGILLIDNAWRKLMQRT